MAAVRDASIERLEQLLSLAQAASSDLQAQSAKLHANVGLLTAKNNHLETVFEEEIAVAEVTKAKCAVLQKKLAESATARTAEKEAHRQEMELLEAARAVAALGLEAANDKAAQLLVNLRGAEQELHAERDNHVRAIRRARQSWQPARCG